MNLQLGCFTFRASGLAVAALVVLFAVSPVKGQTSTAGKVIGTVTDPTGAVVPKAELQILNVGTNAAQSTTSDNSGGFNFPVVPPGIYRLTVKMSGFRTASITDIQVDVEKTNTIAVKLEVGGATETVEVTATAAAALQTNDAQIGNVVSTDNILRLPTLQRDAVELMNLQPGVVAGGSGLTMRVSGAIDDQNTITLDGIDITANLVATAGSLPTPADSVEEFRANVANPSAALMRGSGAQITLIGRRGSNNLHGALYENLQNNDLNANTWDNNRAGLAKAIIHDNRFGGRLGGPIQKNKTFFFGNYEARRFNSVAPVTRTVPTATLRQGIVEVQNGSVLEQFNLKTATVCGANGNSACDPRGLGLNPSVATQWNEMPLPNLAGGDGLNTMSYFSSVPTPIRTDYGVMRLDHVFNEKFTLNTSLTYYRIDQLSSSQISILNGNAASVRSSPERVMVPTASLTWQISPTFLNVFRMGWVRDTGQGNAQTPTTSAGLLNTPGTQTADGPIALLVGSGLSSFIDSPIDMDVSRARVQEQWQQDRELNDDMTKIWGKHQIQYGLQINQLPFTHARADKVYGGTITSLSALVDGDQTYLSIPAANRPLPCGGSVASNCIPSSQSTNWDRYYASALGLVDNVGIMTARDQNLNPLPFGTLIQNITSQWATYFYVQDSWRIKPSLTLYYGLSYGFMTAPVEKYGRQSLMVNAATGQEVDTSAYLAAKQQAALAGQIYNPTLAWEPVNDAHKPIFNADYGDVAPRASLAWNPSAKRGVIGKLLGDHKTVIRGGFAMVYDKSLTVETIEYTMLGIGFAQIIQVGAPLCNATGLGGSGCTASAGSANPGLSSFRVGTDGVAPASDGRSPYIAHRSHARQPTLRPGPGSQYEGRAQLQFRFEYSARVARQHDPGSRLHQPRGAPSAGSD